MKLQYEENKCIICLLPCPEEESFSQEHIIPKALGGVLTCKFLCCSCNNTMGHTFEAKAKTAPDIRRAIYALKNDLPNLFNKIEDRQYVRTESGSYTGSRITKGGKVIDHTDSNDSEQIWACEKDAEAIIKAKLTKAGASPSEINNAIHLYTDTPELNEVDLGYGYATIKHSAYNRGPDYAKGKPLSTLIALKIAYEFSVLAFGTPMLNPEDLNLKEIRRYLKEGDSNFQNLRIEKLHAYSNKYNSRHEISFKGNIPHATFHISLFGSINYIVVFSNVIINSKPFTYTQCLKTGIETSYWA